MTTRTPITRIQGDAMAVNSYLVEGPAGLVVIDGQLTRSDAQKVRAMLDSAAKPVAGLIVTHPHPDHYAGAATMLDGLDAPIVATAAVDAVIRRDDDIKDRIVGPMMGHEWPVERRFPDQVVSPGATVRLGGLAFAVQEVGPAESDADTLWWLDDRTVFAGDLAYNDMHAYLADGRYAEWVAALSALERDLADDVQLLVGHGAPSGKELLGRQRHYVETFVERVVASADLDPEARRLAVVAAMRRIVPNDQLLFLMELSIEPVLSAMGDGP